MKWLGWLRRRLESCVILLALPVYLSALCAFAMIGMRFRNPSESWILVRTSLVRWGRMVLFGLFDLRSVWWLVFAYEPGRMIWRYFFLLEVFDLMNLASRRPKSMASPQRILVVKYGHFGDAIHVLPMLRRLREVSPAARIDLLIGPWSDAVGRATKQVDEIIFHVPAMTLFNRGDLRRVPGIMDEIAFLLSLRHREYDLLISTSTFKRSKYVFLFFMIMKSASRRNSVGN